MIMDNWAGCIGGVLKVLLTLVIVVVLLGIAGNIWGKFGSLQGPIAVVLVLVLLISMAKSDSPDYSDCASTILAFIVAGVIIFGCFYLVLSIR